MSNARPIDPRLTEQRNPRSRRIDQLSTIEIVDLINADRPGIAEGPGVVAPGRFQLEIGFHRESERDPAGRFTTTLMPTLVRAGIGGAAELRVETNGYTRAEAATTAGTERATGWSPLSIGMKYQFLAGDARPVSMALLGRVSPSTGTQPLTSDSGTPSAFR